MSSGRMEVICPCCETRLQVDKKNRRDNMGGEEGESYAFFG